MAPSASWNLHSRRNSTSRILRIELDPVHFLTLILDQEAALAPFKRHWRVPESKVFDPIGNCGASAQKGGRLSEFTRPYMSYACNIIVIHSNILIHIQYIYIYMYTHIYHPAQRTAIILCPEKEACERTSHMFCPNRHSILSKVPENKTC